MKLYLWITQDKYQLPLAVSEHAEEVAKASGCKRDSVYSICSKAKRGKLERPRFIIVEVD